MFQKHIKAVVWNQDEVNALRRISFDETILSKVEQMEVLKYETGSLTEAISQFRFFIR